ncbi:hypothetical protein [Halegenticoccus tardaugens]|uniref:hypothetical protein n=1 Tax=Halegenticoccus tardaugens TaxID=2071624 RepID=UPI001E4949CB|nr:hypothetical protein [Halegenticoccus tardaugens]
MRAQRGGDEHAVGLNGWGHEYVRAESRDATTVLDHRTLEQFDRDPDDDNWVGLHPVGEEIPLLDRDKWGNAWLVEQFVEWLDGGDPSKLRMIDCASSPKSAEHGEPVNVPDFLDAARADAIA